MDRDADHGIRTLLPPDKQTDMKYISHMIRKINHLQEQASALLSINKRNLLFIYPHNARKDYPLADDKLQTKILLQARAISVPETYVVYSYFYQLDKLEADLLAYNEFVIKPAHGRAGGGIIIITGKADGEWIGINNKRYSSDELKHHITEIIFGVYSFDMKDHAIIEKRILQHEDINALSPFGLSDIRVILCRNTPVMAMARLPTIASGGRANIHQGAIGVGIDLESGITRHAVHHDVAVTHHPDTDSPLINRLIPFWPQIIAISIAAAEALPLKYIGADVAVTATGPLIIELNVRPGLAIQAANDASLLEKLATIG
jgi:alpha-L-glutamate ligase-like protein